MVSKQVLVVAVFCSMYAVAVASNPCIAACSGRPNGDYQSCNGCDVYATCANGYLYDNRPCVAGTVWDDTLKRCEMTSTTCPPDPCVSSCNGLANGDYQSCSGCNVYASCNGGFIIDNRPCPATLVWDDSRKACDTSSTTCS
ncbi:uncharacterized protein LOC124119147 [Haliotis rufescens]|uniref:uncharacterized protein LOC124119147 n=1 Tax=Haliotis rufescens TaxID=6454 RepID=UPI00201F6F1D|nr:uncharacterized protein LOC124119147 [Haliotis rufescens]